eukprot:1574348-Rhodomonas_salina.1
MLKREGRREEGEGRRSGCASLSLALSLSVSVFDFVSISVSVSVSGSSHPPSSSHPTPSLSPFPPSLSHTPSHTPSRTLPAPLTCACFCSSMKCCVVPSATSRNISMPARRTDGLTTNPELLEHSSKRRLEERGWAAVRTWQLDAFVLGSVPMLVLPLKAEAAEVVVALCAPAVSVSPPQPQLCPRITCSHLTDAATSSHSTHQIVPSAPAPSFVPAPPGRSIDVST